MPISAETTMAETTSEDLESVTATSGDVSYDYSNGNITSIEQATVQSDVTVNDELVREAFEITDPNVDIEINNTDVDGRFAITLGVEYEGELLSQEVTLYTFDETSNVYSNDSGEIPNEMLRDTEVNTSSTKL